MELYQCCLFIALWAYTRTYILAKQRGNSKEEFVIMRDILWGWHFAIEPDFPNDNRISHHFATMGKNLLFYQTKIHAWTYRCNNSFYKEAQIPETAKTNYKWINHNKLNTDSELWLGQCKPIKIKLHNLHQIKIPQNNLQWWWKFAQAQNSNSCFNSLWENCPSKKVIKNAP